MPVARPWPLAVMPETRPLYSLACFWMTPMWPISRPSSARCAVGVPVPERLLAIAPRLVGRVDLFEVRHAHDADVAAEGQRLHAVLGLAPANRPEPRAEPHEELGDLHAAPLGRDEVAQLVQHDHGED